MEIVSAVLGVILTAVILGEAAAAFYFVHMITKPAVPTAREQYARLVRKGLLKRELHEGEGIKKETFVLRSEFGYPLHCELLTGREALGAGRPAGAAVLCHGLTSCRYGMLPYAESYLKRGFAVVLYDQRNHGDSGKAFTSMGYYEKYDLEAVVRWCKQRFGAGTKIVTHGGSMGAATVLCHLAVSGSVTCAVADCGFHDFREQMRYLAKNKYHLPAFPIIGMIRFLIRLRYGFDPYRVRPGEGAAGSVTPVLFIHGEADRFVPAWMSKRMFESRRGGKKLLLVPGADHGESMEKEPERYDAVVGKFLREFL